MKRAVLQVADQGPLESLVKILESGGYQCFLPGSDLRARLQSFGGLVLSPEDLHRSMGYDMPFPMAETNSLDCDLFVDVKAHQTYYKLVAAFPHLAYRVLWYRINGGKPEHVVKRENRVKAVLDRHTLIACAQDHGKLESEAVFPHIGEPRCRCVIESVVVEDCGDEVNPPCPVLTPNQWYREWNLRHWEIREYRDANGNDTGLSWCDECKTGESGLDEQACKSYTCWPPFVRFHEYHRPRQPFHSPICLIHNLQGWGYGKLIEPMRALGVRMYGRGSPDGLIQHAEMPRLLSTARCMVHLKSSDAPGYAIYEALAAACPIICTRRLIWRCQMQDLLIPNETCLVFDRETHDGLTDADVTDCTNEVREHLNRLRDDSENRRIGNNGRKRLVELMWRADRDDESLRKFMARNFS